MMNQDEGSREGSDEGKGDCNNSDVGCVSFILSHTHTHTHIGTPSAPHTNHNNTDEWSKFQNIPPSVQYHGTTECLWYN